MNSPAFQLNKVRRLIKTQGVQLKFQAPGKNEFGEAEGKPSIHVVRGVFHESTHFSSGYVTKASADSSTTRLKSQPMILALWEYGKDIELDSELNFNGKSYKVNDITNIAQANLVADISLEEVQS